MKFYSYENVRIYDVLGAVVNLLKYELVKETPKGYWIKPSWDYSDEYKRWVSNNGKNRHAYPTKEEALLNFQRRKEREIFLLKDRLENAQSALYQVPNLNKELEDANN